MWLLLSGCCGLVVHGALLVKLTAHISHADLNACSNHTQQLRECIIQGQVANRSRALIPLWHPVPRPPVHQDFWVCVCPTIAMRTYEGPQTEPATFRQTLVRQV
jgi:hypothetical protein